MEVLLNNNFFFTWTKVPDYSPHIELNMFHSNLNYFFSDCKALFHTKCIQNGGVLTLPCHQTPGPGGGGSRKSKQRKLIRSQAPAGPPAHLASHSLSQFSLTGTSEFTDRTDKIISDVRELQLMQDFITKKVWFHW